MKRKYIIILIVAGVVALIAFKLVANKHKIDKKNRPDRDSILRIPVKAAAVKEELQEISLVKTGDLAPFREAKVLTTIGGTIKQLRFSLGDEVHQGQILAIMDTRLMQLDLQKAETNAAKLKADLQTYTELLHGQAATQEKVNEIRQNYLDAVNQVSQVKKQISDAAVRSPTEGTISEKPLEEGVYAAAGANIASVVNLSQAKVRLNLTEREVYSVQTGQEVKITTDVYPGQVFKGRISFISPQADETHNYKVEIIAENKENTPLRSGTFVYADFSRKTTQKILLIPREALTESVKDAAVYQVQNDVVRLKPIRAGLETTNGMVQVLSGIKTGDTVVTSGQINLKSGAQVTVTK
ncbi:MAG: efflux RND transporter periplasmic adaptor subunit [Mucilaginibacter polytrichastri]|nr:efflux RND transporter periplasmic adaptor subunit [Mucilaginibacter polytrichastri]